MFAVISTTILAFILFIGQITIANAMPIGSRLCQDEVRFVCYKVKKNETWQKLYPDFRKRDMVMRINRMNTSLENGMKIAVPKNLDTTIMDYAPFAKFIDPPGEKVIFVSINPNVLAWGAYDAIGILQAWGPVSGGKGWCPDIGHGCHTAVGKFAIYQKEGPGCVSTKFPVGRGGAPMPYCMFFHGGYALHGSYEVPGYNASHGCVRLLVPDAKWLNREFVADTTGVRVIVRSE